MTRLTYEERPGTGRPADLIALLERSAERYASRRLFGTRREEGWRWLTYGEFHELVSAFASGLQELGVRAGDRIAIVGDNRLEWAVAAYATYACRATFVPMYSSQHPEEWQFTLGDSGASIVLGDGIQVVETLCAMRSRLPELAHVIGVGAAPDGVLPYEELLTSGASRTEKLQRPTPGELAGLFYTSGTTGAPKGVMLSHGNICANVNALNELFPLDQETSLSFLPWAHAFGQCAELHNMLAAGGAVAINDDPANLLRNLAEVRPTILFAVPRVFKRVFEAISEQVSERPAPIRALFRSGLKAAIARSRSEPVGPIKVLAQWAADALIFSKVRDRLGGKLRYAISGSAALHPDIADFVDAIGVTVFEGYGLTETSPVVSTNYPGHRRLGSVGRPIPGVKVVVDEDRGGEGDGEILVYGPNVMQGYHGRPDETHEVLMPDGGLRTGDLGRLDDDGYLFITGRIKEQFKLENGKYVAPSPLEEQLSMSPYIESAFVYGDNRPYTVALIVLDEEAASEWLTERGGASSHDLTSDPAVHDLVEAELERQAASFKSFERPKRFAIVTEGFTTENGLLTPTLKLKRARVFEKYHDAVEALYGEGLRERRAQNGSPAASG